MKFEETVYRLKVTAALVGMLVATGAVMWVLFHLSEVWAMPLGLVLCFASFIGAGLYKDLMRNRWKRSLAQSPLTADGPLVVENCVEQRNAYTDENDIPTSPTASPGIGGAES